MVNNLKSQSLQHTAKSGELSTACYLTQLISTRNRSITAAAAAAARERAEESENQLSIVQLQLPRIGAEYEYGFRSIVFYTLETNISPLCGFIEDNLVIFLM
jgi:hypothetical protein